MLYALTKANPKLRNAIIKLGDPELVKTICEIALNTLNGNNPVGNKMKKKLARYKRDIRCVACSKRSLKSKRKILVQKGGFLPLLIGTVLSGILSTLFDHHG